MDERKGLKWSQKGVSSPATHLQTHRKIKAAPGQGGEGPRGKRSGLCHSCIPEFQVHAPGPGWPLTQGDLEAQPLWDSFSHPLKMELII